LSWQATKTATNTAIFTLHKCAPVTFTFLWPKEREGAKKYSDLRICIE
jgi:hypothetical protein